MVAGIDETPRLVEHFIAVDRNGRAAELRHYAERAVARAAVLHFQVGARRARRHFRIDGRRVGCAPVDFKRARRGQATGDGDALSGIFRTQMLNRPLAFALGPAGDRATSHDYKIGLRRPLDDCVAARTATRLILQRFRPVEAAAKRFKTDIH